jgi:diadenosine tetraphosphate (Ap4A) HIT family hydrolase
MKNETLDDADVPWKDPVKDDFHVTVYKDGYPVTEGHLLFVPKYNTPEVIQDAFYDAYKHGLELVKQGFCQGFNVGINVGEAAGQTVMYPHIHLIPRSLGDVVDPVGGIRNVIPEKGNYRKKNV